MSRPPVNLRALIRAAPPLRHAQLRLRPALRPSTSPARLTVRSQSNGGSLPTFNASSSPQVGHHSDLYWKPAVASVQNVGRILKLCLYVLFGAGVFTAAGFEAWHLYLEEYMLGAPSRAPADPAEDPFGWQEERTGWTGGARGGTDPRLGLIARHALRAAWSAQHWGTGAEGPLVDSYRGSGLHADRLENYNFSARVHNTDQGYAMAVLYLETVLDKARKKGWAFPPNLSATRSVPPERLDQGDKEVDETVRDLFMLKAGVMERIGEKEALDVAKELYEQVLVSTKEGPSSQARVLRLAGKLGDLAARLGQSEEATSWWSWGLARAGLPLDPVQDLNPKTEKRGWFGSFTRKSDISPANPTAAILTPTMPPATLRATISLLSSAEAHYAQTGQLTRAATLQQTALALIPLPAPSETIPSGSAGQALHAAWLQQRRSVLTLHQAAVQHAQGKTALPLAVQAAEEAEHALASLHPVPAVYDTSKSVLMDPARALRRDAVLTAAEAAYTKGILIEKQKKSSLADAADCFERAVEVYELESKEGDEVRGKDWERYWGAFARVKGEMGQEVENRIASASEQIVVRTA